MMNVYEKNIDSEQLKIWQIDSERYKEHEKDIVNKVFINYNYNLIYFLFSLGKRNEFH